MAGTGSGSTTATLGSFCLHPPPTLVGTPPALLRNKNCPHRRDHTSPRPDRDGGAAAEYVGAARPSAGGAALIPEGMAEVWRGAADGAGLLRGAKTEGRRYC